MSALDQKQISAHVSPMSALPPKANVRQRSDLMSFRLFTPPPRWCRLSDQSFWEAHGKLAQAIVGVFHPRYACDLRGTQFPEQNEARRLDRRLNQTQITSKAVSEQSGI